MIALFRFIIIACFTCGTYTYAFQIGVSIKSEPINLFELNTKFDDFAPRWSKWENKLYFNSIINGVSTFLTSEYSDGAFSTPAIVKSPINRKSDSRSYISFVNRNEAILGAFHKYKRRPYINLYTSVFVKNGWSEPEIISSFQNEAFMSQPTVSPTGDLLIFVSDMGNSGGETDLWMAWKTDDNTWSIPVRIDELNSHRNEITPYLHTSDTLFFASDGYEGPGGYDIYYSVSSGGKWERPRPLNDINTEYDESDPAIILGDKFIFASNRPGGAGGLDLYMAEIAYGQPQVIVTDAPKLNIQFQVANIGATKSQNRFIYPAINYMPKIYIDNLFLHGARTSNFFHDYLRQIFIMMQENIKIELLTESNEHGRRLCELLNDWGIEPHRTKPAITSADVNLLEVELINCKECRIINAGNLHFSLKPEMLDIAITGANLPQQYKINFSMKHLSHNELIQIPGDSIPARFLYPISNFSQSLFQADDLIFSLDIHSQDKVIASTFKSLPITRTEIGGELTIFHENRVFKAYPIPCFDGKSVVKSDNITNYLNYLAERITPRSRVTIFYTEDINSKYSKDIATQLSSRSGIRNIRAVKIASEDLPNSYDSQNSIIIGIAD